jgi:tetratricopeptide (TPR) repeat protein
VLDPIRELEEIVAEDPSFADAWSEIAQGMFDRGCTIEAIESAIHALKSEPRCLRISAQMHPHAEAAAVLGRCLESVGELALAATAYQKSLEVDDMCPPIHVRLANLLWDAAETELALGHFDRGMTFVYKQPRFPTTGRHLESLVELIKG